MTDQVATKDGPRRTIRQQRRNLSTLLLVLFTLTGVALGGCSSPRTDIAQAPLVPPEMTIPDAPLPTYRIQIGDVLDVRLLLNPELNEEVRVRPDGRISTAVVPDEVAYGRTVEQLTAILRAAYAKDLYKPRISVVVKTVSPTRLYVSGEVNAPGEFATIGPSLTLSQAIARAGGIRPSGDVNQIFIIRRGVGDRPELLATRYDAVMRGTDPNADVRLAAYDVVYVPKTGIAEVYQWYQQFVQQFTNASFGFTYLINQPPVNRITP